MERLKNKENAVLWAKKILICLACLMVLGIGCGINVGAMQGADPITVFYEGMSKFFHIKMGTAANIINWSFVALVFFVNRKYVNIGTVVHMFTLGMFLQWGVDIYHVFHIPNQFIWQVLASIVGCLLCFVSLGGFIAINIGVDSWTAVTMVLSDKFGKSFKVLKVTLDILTLILGWLMGGTVGVITIFSAVVGGPLIQKSAEVLDKLFNKMLKSGCEAQIED